jgi:hypothetical protein
MEMGPESTIHYANEDRVESKFSLWLGLRCECLISSLGLPNGDLTHFPKFNLKEESTDTRAKTPPPARTHAETHSAPRENPKNSIISHGHGS